MKNYDYLIVGTGLFGSVFAHEMTQKNKRCLVIDKRSAVGGNIACEESNGINIHKYGAHIFHTNNKTVWDYVNKFAEFNNYINSPIANYKNELYNLPFNMNTFYALWKTKTPEEAKAKIDEQKAEYKNIEPKNLEEKALSLVGRDIYEKLIKGYTEKQWGRSSKELPAFIISRLPLRFTYDNNYFNDRYQGIPIGGYNVLINNLLKNIEVKLDTNFFSDRKYFESIADKIIFTGAIDEFFDYKFGELEYRSLRFNTEILDMESYQGNAVVNYTEKEVPFTRIIEHKHFEGAKSSKTVVTKEYPSPWKKGDEPYYAVNNDANNALYAKYKDFAKGFPNIIFAGRLGDYKYYDMHHVVEKALALTKQL